MKSSIRPLLVNTFDQTGGAARAAYRLLGGLRRSGSPAQMVVRGKSSGDDAVIKCESDWLGWCKGVLDILPLKAYPGRQQHNFSPARVPDQFGKMLARLQPDLLHLHWMSYGFFKIETLALLDMPIVWTLHDSWPFSGGCHLPGECRKFLKMCGACPVLDSTKQDDLSHRVWMRKRKSYALSRLNLVAPSRWMAERARESSLLGAFPLDVIPNGVDVNLFSPGSRLAARDRLGLPQEGMLILFGARHALSDRNKGFGELCQALKQLPSELRGQTILVSFGESPDTPLPDLGVKVVSLGEITNDNHIVDLYRAADVLVVCSHEENLPNMISEAMACGLPCVAFDVGGISDQVVHRRTGCLASPQDSAALASEISWLLSRVRGEPGFSSAARKHAVENFALEHVARLHLELYRRVLEPVPVREVDKR